MVAVYANILVRSGTNNQNIVKVYIHTVLE